MTATLVDGKHCGKCGEALEHDFEFESGFCGHCLTWRNEN